MVVRLVVERRERTVVDTVLATVETDVVGNDIDHQIHATVVESI